MDITVIRDGKKFTFPGKENISLSEQLREQKIYISAPCGGSGKCGKCKVQMIAGASDVTESDRRFLKESELEQGWRLACTAYPDGDCTIAVCSGEESEFEVISAYEETAEAGTAGRTRAVRQAEPAVEAGKDNSYGVGIDIGTTTIVLQLVGETSGRILHTVTMVNRQRSFGADVISRIQASNEGNKEALQDCIRRDLYEGMKHLIRESDTDGEKIARIVIAANTTMGHLLMGYSCETLGVYPFTPVNISRITTGFSELFAGQQQEDGEEALDIDAEIILLPGISAYVGADIAAGMLVCDFDKREKPCLLIDLGTNGEMAVGDKDKILVTSVAAGPAFEGGNISCGMGSVPGAVCNISIQEGTINRKTIGDKPPIGLCGTGVIETVYELVKEKTVDETGLLAEEYFDRGFEIGVTPSGEPILFTQKDIREIQLAKSAIRAGVETLLKRYGITYGEVDRVFLAGGFGYQIDLEKTIGIGMLPAEFWEKITAIGNSSLGGAVLYLTKKDAGERLDKILGSSEEIELSLDKDFNELYTEYMYFVP